MSEFFRALEQAERDRLVREGARADLPPLVPDPLPIPEPPAAPVPAPAPAPAPAPPSAAAGGAATALAPPPAEAVGAATAGKPEPVRPRTRPETRPGRGQAPGRRLGQDGFPEGLDDRLVSLLTPEAFAAEQYRALRYTVEQLRSHSGLSVVAVSSPSVGDGKTTTAINLAGALAQAPDARILLIEADLRRPSIARRLGLGLPPRPGLVRAILSPDVALESVVRPCPPFNGLSVLLAGSGRSSPYELLHSPRLGELLEEARRRYDYVVLDTPPIVGAPDCQVLAQWVDGMLVVVRAHRTPRKLLEEALNLMEPAKVVGLVFNQDDRPLWGYYGYCQPEEGNHRGNGGNGGNGWRRWLSASLHGRRASWLAKAPR